MRSSFRLGLVSAVCAVTILVAGCVVLVLNPYSLRIITGLRVGRVSSTQQASSSAAEPARSSVAPPLLSPLPAAKTNVEVQQDILSFADQAAATARDLGVVPIRAVTRTPTRAPAPTPTPAASQTATLQVTRLSEHPVSNNPAPSALATPFLPPSPGSTRIPPAPTTAPKPKPAPTAAPKPKPTAAPKPKPAPTTAPKPKPTAAPKPKPKPTAAPKPKPTAAPKPKPTAAPKPKPTAAPKPTRPPKP